DAQLDCRVLEYLLRDRLEVFADLIGQRYLLCSWSRLDVAQADGEAARQVRLQVVKADTQRLGNAHQVFVEGEQEFMKARDLDRGRRAGVVGWHEIPPDQYGLRVLRHDSLAAVFHKAGAKGLNPSCEVI